MAQLLPGNVAPTHRRSAPARMRRAVHVKDVVLTLLAVTGLLAPTACTRSRSSQPSPQQKTASATSARQSAVPGTGARLLNDKQRRQVLLGLGSSWRYLDGGMDPGAGWAAPAFNDESWKQGEAQLGFGEGDETTVLSFGADPASKPITTFFRAGFDLGPPGQVKRLFLRVVHDDGAVIYINGVEVLRRNLPVGPVTATTRALSALLNASDEESEIDLALFPSLLRPGRNVLAVEVHQHAPDSPELSFDLSLESGPSVLITRGPYLQMGGPTQATICWRTDVPVRGRVTATARDAGQPPLLVEEPTPVRDHQVRLAGLAADTRYDYTVGTLEEVLAGGDGNHHFLTAPPPGTRRPTRVWVIGDSGTADLNAAAVYNSYLSTMDLQRPADLWLMLGDNAYWSGTDDEYQRAVFDLYTELLPRVFLWPALGNHETYFHAQGQPYLDIFNLPTRGEIGGLASGTELYYSFDHGDIHFVVLDSMVSSRAPGGAMLTWLKADLEATTRTWLVALWHHPPYSKGHHDSDNASGVDPELRDMRQNAVPILEEHGVDLVLSGHSHAYERSYLLQGHHGLSETLDDQMKLDHGSGRPRESGAYTKVSAGRGPREGAVYAVAGSSGQAHGPLTRHPAMFVSMLTLGSLVLDIDGLRLTGTFLDSQGKVQDDFVIEKGVPPATLPPDRPRALTAVAEGADGVSLNWRYDGRDETGFVVERALEGESFVARHRMGANAAAWRDTGVPSGMRIWYRVRATNAAGASEPSNEAGVLLVQELSDAGRMPNDGSTPLPDVAVKPEPQLRAGGGGGCQVARAGDAERGAWWLLAMTLLVGWIAFRRRRPHLMTPLPLAMLVMLATSPSAKAHGLVSEALNRANAEIARAPRDAAAHARRAELHRQSGDALAALADLQRAQDLDPSLPQLQLRLGLTSLEAGQPHRARAHIERQLAATPGHPQALLLRGRLSANLGDHGAAARDYQAAVDALAARATPDEHLLLVNTLVRAGQPQRAAQALERASRLLGPVASLELAAIDLSLARGRHEEALRRIDRLAQTSPRPDGWLLRRADILLAGGRRQEAAQAYARARAAIAQARDTPARRSLLLRAQQGLAQASAR